jgi:hypothetical protein
MPIDLAASVPLTRASRRLRVLSWIGLCIALAAGSMRWFFASKEWMPPAVVAWMPSDGLSIAQRIAGFAIEMMPLGAVLYTFMALDSICARYARGEIFGSRAGSAYRSLGKGVLCLGITNALYTTLIIAVFTFSFEKRAIVIGFGLSHADLYLLIIGGAVMMLGHVMDEAGRLHRENSEFV